MKNIKTYSEFAQINESMILKFDIFKNCRQKPGFTGKSRENTRG